MQSNSRDITSTGKIAASPARAQAAKAIQVGSVLGLSRPALLAVPDSASFAASKLST